MTCPPFTIRTATTSDAKIIASINVASWRETYKELLPPEMLSGVNMAARTKQWSNILDSAKDASSLEVFIAEIQGAAVGYVSIGNQRVKELAGNGFSAEITSVYVLKTAQRLGVGRGLLRQAAHHLQRYGHSAASLWVLDTNTNARSFYMALGAQSVLERDEISPEGTIHEVAYGWTDLSSLIK